MNVTDRIITNHKSKSKRVKRLKLKLKNAISLSKLQDKLAQEELYKIDGRDYYGFDDYDHNGYIRDSATREARIELLKELIQERSNKK